MTESPRIRDAADRRSPLILDFALDLRRKGYLGFFENAWKRYGDLARFDIGPGTLFMIIHPEHVRHISISARDRYGKGQSYDAVRRLLLGNGLLTSTGDLWRRQRRLMAPFFTPRGIESYFELMVDDGLWFAGRWERLAAGGTTVDMLNEMTIITASIILKTMFSMEADEDIVEMKDAVETMIRFTAGHEMNPLSLPLWIPIGPNRAYVRARERVHRYIDGVIAQRRAVPEAAWPDDLLGRLMQARDTETGEMMTDDLLRDEAITIFFAGHETTARTLSFLWLALAQNPDVEQRLHQEIDRVVGHRRPTLAQLHDLPYTLQVIKETLRLYPPAPVYVRDALAEDEMDGVRVPAGSRMITLPYLTHRHPGFWDEPARFDPERWTPEREAARHPQAYHPFAVGRRICIGNHFSLFESQILVALLATRFLPRPVPGHRPIIEMAGTLVSRNGLPMTIGRRRP